MTSVFRRGAEDVVDMAFAVADTLAKRTGDDFDRALTIGLEAIRIGLRDTTHLSPSEVTVTAIDLLLDAVAAA